MASDLKNPLVCCHFIYTTQALDRPPFNGQIQHMNMTVAKPSLTIRLCGPRGFCAGVDRAIQIVVLAIKKYGAPVYVRHEIVHNRYVVEGLQERGAVFIEELHEIPDEHQAAPVIFSAHGVPKSVPAASAPLA
jgi:4-hydroxy-3-methylbut-2-en-1-yl diphosphate reductase